jgi:hypothetical protein
MRPISELVFAASEMSNYAAGGRFTAADYRHDCLCYLRSVQNNAAVVFKPIKKQDR